MFAIVLYQPEIPPNTGNVLRLAANTGAVLHLIEPLGFSFEDRQLARAGLDYSDISRARIHPDWTACTHELAGRRMFMLSTRGTTRYDTPRYAPGDVFVFGPETRGLPQLLLQTVPAEQRLRLPMVAGNRSLNLSNTVAIAVYEAWRQVGFAGRSGS